MNASDTRHAGKTPTFPRANGQHPGNIKKNLSMLIRGWQAGRRSSG
jgi:hypothetical protein